MNAAIAIQGTLQSVKEGLAYPRSFLSSVRGRLTASVVLIVLAGLAVSASVSLYFLRQSVGQMGARQQASSVSFAADMIDRQLEGNIQELKGIANPLRQQSEKFSSEYLQSFLEKEVILHRSSFNWGVFIVDSNGTAVASVPRGQERVGINYTNNPTVSRSLSSGNLEVGVPVYDQITNDPILSIAVPVKNTKGKVVGVVVGATNLAKPNFFQTLDAFRNGTTGNFHVISPKDGQFVASTDVGRMLKPLPIPGKNSLHDRVMAGYEGTDVTRTSTGSVELASAKYLTHADWAVISTTPVEEAFSPVQESERFRVYIAGFVLILTGFAVYLMLRRALLPINRLADEMKSIGGGQSKFHKLSWDQDNEIGNIVESFNGLMNTVEIGKAELLRKEEFSRAIIDSMGALVCVVDDNGTIVKSNQRWEKFHQKQNAIANDLSTLGMNYLSLCPDGALFSQDMNLSREISGGITSVLHRGKAYFGCEYIAEIGNGCAWYTLRALRMSNAPLTIITHEDITDEKRVDELRTAAIAFETSEGILIADRDFNIIRVNNAIVALSGYDANELVGHTPTLLKSDKHTTTQYAKIKKHLHSNGNWSGEFWLRRKDGEVRPQLLTITTVKGAIGEISGYVAIFNDISERKHAEEKIHTLAFYDSLTNLPNRSMLRDRLAVALETSQQEDLHCAVLSLDLDNFKDLNDIYGHSIGDGLLVQLSQRLADTVQNFDTVARLGGDEFVVLLERLDSDAKEAERQAARVAEKILNRLAEPYCLIQKDGSKVANAGYICTSSIGVALFKGSNQKIEDLLKRSDIAMHHAKSASKNAVAFFDLSMQEQIEKRAVLEADMRDALDKNQFKLYYQLQVDSEGLPIGAEGLIRWKHPVRGMISPADFIPIAEQSGAIIPIGNWVIEEACRQLKGWMDDANLRHLTIAVNVSALQFQHAGFVDSVRRSIQESGAPAQQLKLELTETIVHNDIASTVEKLDQLRSLGVCFALDDFGTGYSSLSYLQDMPIDQIKIDQSFVADLGRNSKSEAIVRSIIALSEELGMDVIAEGVETQEQKAFLSHNGCHQYQGYLYAPPQNQEIFLETIAKIQRR